MSEGTIQHEFLHALGFKHEQTRADRDDHINVFFENILPDFASNYAKIEINEWEDVGSPYDFTSVMHYGSDFFITQEASDAGLFTMTKLNGEPIVSQRNGATSIDLHQLTYAYDGFCAGQVQFDSCKNGDPLLPARVCDGNADCVDGSDEGEDCLVDWGCCASFELEPKISKLLEFSFF